MVYLLSGGTNSTSWNYGSFVETFKNQDRCTSGFHSWTATVSTFHKWFDFIYFELVFADDSILITFGSNIHSIGSKLTNDLSITSEWAINNRMVLNYSKTKTMQIYSKRTFGILDPISIKLNCNNIEEVSSAKVLGLSLIISWTGITRRTTFINDII